eukprot:GHVQ01020178.1.p1 GENE.GHVQ01020178.1~~GHVQ01020178.1.p1  ORF type:complete len:299 (-),score=28.35 GHVQ01020178.1:983-1879(-)
MLHLLQVYGKYTTSLHVRCLHTSPTIPHIYMRMTCTYTGLQSQVWTGWCRKTYGRSGLCGVCMNVYQQSYSTNRFCTYMHTHTPMRIPPSTHTHTYTETNANTHTQTNLQAHSQTRRQTPTHTPTHRERQLHTHTQPCRYPHACTHHTRRHTCTNALTIMRTHTHACMLAHTHTKPNLQTHTQTPVSTHSRQFFLYMATPRDSDSHHTYHRGLSLNIYSSITCTYIQPPICPYICIYCALYISCHLPIYMHILCAVHIMSFVHIYAYTVHCTNKQIYQIVVMPTQKVTVCICHWLICV